MGAAVLVISFGANASVWAFDNIRGCDIVNFATTMVHGITLPLDAVKTYQERVRNIARMPVPGDQSFAIAADEIMRAQEVLLGTASGQTRLTDYLRSDVCEVIVELNNDPLDDESTKALLTTSRLRLQDALSRIRFGSEQDKTLFKAGYNCFIAGYLFGLKPMRQGESLTKFGQTRTCKELQRSVD